MTNFAVTASTGAIPTTRKLTDAQGNLTPSYQAWFNTLQPGGGQNKSNAYFQSGFVQYAGPNGFNGDINFEFGTNLPNPSGVDGACLLLGSGPGAGNGAPAQFWIITDQAYDNVTQGNTLGITAGETQPSGSAQGGTLWLIGGASFGGLGGTLQLQGGTSLNGHGGATVVQGGNSTRGIPGDLFLTGGQNGVQGANVHLIMTTLNNLAGVVRIRNNSDIIMDIFHDGSIYLYKGGGFGTNGQHLTSQGPGLPVKWA